MQEKYLGGKVKKKFSVSAQYYSFAVKAFVNTVKEFDTFDYEFAVYETKTPEVINDVASMKSEIGLLYLSDFNRQILTKLLQANHLKMFSKIQKEPVKAFIFITETMRQGLTGFFDLYAKYIKNVDIINAFKALSISNKYINVIEEMPAKYADPWDKYWGILSEEEIEAKVEQSDAYYDKYYKLLIKYNNENEEINKKITDYVRQYNLEFFEYK